MKTIKKMLSTLNTVAFIANSKFTDTNFFKNLRNKVKLLCLNLFRASMQNCYKTCFENMS